MALLHVKLTDSAISAHVALLNVSVLRDTQNPLLQLRFKTNRCTGVWRILFRNKWHKVGEWPETKTRDIRHGFSVLINKIRNNQEAKAAKDCFSNVGDLLKWYEERKSDDANLSGQRKKDIKSAVKCHLLPRLESVDFEDLTHAFLDRNFIWPLQKELTKSTVAKLFRTLKTAFYDASHLHMIASNPLINMKITDFGDFVTHPKGSALHPYMVQALLDELEQQKPITQMIVLLMLTLGTRIGETRKAKWKNFNLGSQSVWVIPADDTKTSKSHSIYLPDDIVKLLLSWKEHQLNRHYKGEYLFPGTTEKTYISSNEASTLIHEFSGGEWLSHDLRKCARICWAENGVDYMVAERMLNHELNKIAEAYLDTKVKTLRLEALITHISWLKSLKENCFILNLEPTPNTDKAEA